MGSQSSRWRRSWRWSSRIRFLFRGLQLLVADRGRENRLQSALLTLTDHRVRGGKGRHEGGNAEHVQQDMFVSERVEAAGSRVKTATSGWTQNGTGTIAMATVSERLRRKSRSSLRIMARTRLARVAEGDVGPDRERRRQRRPPGTVAAGGGHGRG